jgi:hypothetical protein
MMKVTVVFKRLLASGKLQHGRHLVQMGVVAGIYLASILLKEMRDLVYIRYLCADHIYSFCFFLY